MNRVSAEANLRHVQFPSEAGEADLPFTFEPDAGRARAWRRFALLQYEDEDSLACLVREFKKSLCRSIQLHETYFLMSETLRGVGIAAGARKSGQAGNISRRQPRAILRVRWLQEICLDDHGHIQACTRSPLSTPGRVTPTG